MNRVNRSLADLTAILLHCSFLNSVAASFRFFTSSCTVVAELVDSMERRPLMVAMPADVPELMELRNSVTATVMLADMSVCLKIARYFNLVC